MNPLIFIVLGLLVGGGLLVYFFFFVREEDEDEEKPGGSAGAKTRMEGADADTRGESLQATSAEYKGARKRRLLAFKDSLERTLDRQGEGAEATDRMSMPWFLLVGAAGSGKTTMLANTGLPLPYGPAFEVDSRKRGAGRWWLFEDAVVLEAPPASAGAAAGDSTLSPGQSNAPDSSHGWSTLLELLRSERPDSPLNGIIVTVSCADLVAGARDSERLVEVAERIRSFLDRVRKVLGVRLPLHVLVTKCDVLPGFRSFADNLPAGRHNDIFGWANPNRIESAFNPSWIDAGYEALKKELEVLRDEVLAAPDEITDADGLFVFVKEFGNLQEPLRDFVSRLYPEGEKRPSLFFRGMSFCGDRMDPALKKSLEAEHLASGTSRATMQLSAEVALTGATKSHNLVFLKSLFSEKIFKEAGLARPMARFRLSRDRRVVAAQAAAAIIAVVGGTGLWTTVNGGLQRGDAASQRGLKVQAEALAHTLAGMAIDLDDVRHGGGAVSDSSMERRSREAAVIELVDEMRSLRALQRSPFIPTSWFSRLPDEVRASMETGIRDIVLPVIRQRLEERSSALLDSTTADSVDGPGSVVGNSGALADYFSDVKDVSKRLAQYNTLATRGSGAPPDLASLMDYLFGVQLDMGRRAVTQDFQIALKAADAKRISLPPNAEAMVFARSMRMLSTLGDQAGRQLAKPRNAQAERAIRPADDLTALRQLRTLVVLSDSSRGLVASGANATILKVNLARQVQDSIAAQLRTAAIWIRGDSGAIDLVTAHLRNAIDTLFSLRLMDPIEEREIVADFGPHQRLRWDVGSLELALSMQQEHTRAVFTLAGVMDGQSRTRMRRAFDLQMRARVLDAVASAQRVTPINAGTVPTVEVGQGATNLEAAAERLLRLASLLDTLGAGAEGKRLLASATRQAEQTIGMAAWILESENSLLPQPARVIGWQGFIPVGWAAVGVTDSLPFESARLRLQGLVRSLTADVAPALQFLGRVPAADIRIPKLVSDWNALSATMQQFDKGDNTTSVAELRRYLVADLAARDPLSCIRAAAAPDNTKESPDPFVKRRRLFRAALVGRCGNGGAEAAAAYQKLRTVFMTRVAGRYPFVDSSQSQAPDVDPVTLRDFLLQYDVFMASGVVALRTDAALLGPAREANAFLTAMVPVRAFLAPLVDAADRKPPEFVVVTPPADSATNRELTIGGTTAPLDFQARQYAWRFGDAIRLVQHDSARAHQVFSAARGWSILELPGQATVRIFHPTTRVELTPPPAYPAVAPGIVIAGAPVAVPAVTPAKRP